MFNLFSLFLNFLLKPSFYHMVCRHKRTLKATVEFVLADIKRIMFLLKYVSFNFVFLRLVAHLPSLNLVDHGIFSHLHTQSRATSSS